VLKRAIIIFCFVHAILLPIVIYGNPLLFSEKTDVIIIDPAHGGVDQGAMTSYIVSGQQMALLEKNITLHVAENLKEQLMNVFPNTKIIMTRDDDVFMSLEERVETVNSLHLTEEQRAVFISIHANYSMDKYNRGYEIFIGNESNENLTIAEKVHIGFTNVIGETLPFRGIQQSDFFILQRISIPAIIIELGFLSNNQDLVLFYSDNGIENYSTALLQGILAYIESLD
jgi:N-acetylmuramoyl-L-alanine amidase